MEFTSSRRFPQRFGAAVVASTCLLLAAMQPARAVVLEQQWKAEQQLAYDVALNGTLNFQAPVDRPSPIAGIPIEALLSVKGQTTLDTLEVDEHGSGTVVMRLDQLQSRADAFGQRVELTFQNGRARFLMNGQPLQGGMNLDWSLLSNPPLAWRVSKQGRFESIVPIGKGTAAATANDAAPNDAAPEDAPADAPNNPNPGSLPVNVPGLIQSLIFRAMPALWPNNEVQPNDKWTAEMRWPLPARAGANATAEATPPLGKAEFMLRGEETVAGRKTQRIAVEGAFQLTEQQAAVMAGAAQAQRQGEQNQGAAGAADEQPLVSARQRFKGDLWFDAAAGQIVRAELELQGRGQRRTTDGKNADDGGWMDFAGTLQVQLRKVSYTGTANTAEGAVAQEEAAPAAG